MKPEASQVPGGWSGFIGTRESVAASGPGGRLQSKSKQSSLDTLITMFDTATHGSKGSGFAGNVENASAGNDPFMPGEKRLGSVGEAQTVEGVECPRRNRPLVDRRFFFGEARGDCSYPGLRLVQICGKNFYILR